MGVCFNTLSHRPALWVAVVALSGFPFMLRAPACISPWPGLSKDCRQPLLEIMSKFIPVEGLSKRPKRASRACDHCRWKRVSIPRPVVRGRSIFRL
jgi:hypothetical protein